MQVRALAGGVALATVLTCPALLQGQVTFGADAGLTFSTITGNDVDEGETENKTGFYAGGSVGFPLGGIMGLGTGAYYVQKGSGMRGGAGSLDLAYLEVPVLLQVRATRPERPVAVAFLIGPSLGFNLSCEDPDGTDCGDRTKSFDLGALFGAGASFSAGAGATVGVNAGLDLGLTSIDEREGFEDVKNQAYFVGVSVSFPLGG